MSLQALGKPLEVNLKCFECHMEYWCSCSSCTATYLEKAMREAAELLTAGRFEKLPDGVKTAFGGFLKLQKTRILTPDIDPLVVMQIEWETFKACFVAGLLRATLGAEKEAGK